MECFSICFPTGEIFIVERNECSSSAMLDSNLIVAFPYTSLVRGSSLVDLALEPSILAAGNTTR